MHYANGDDSLHHLLTRQQHAELQVESSDRNPGSDMAYLILNPLICELRIALLDALQNSGLRLQHHDHLTSAACSWGSFCAGSCRYFLTVIYIVLSDYERD